MARRPRKQEKGARTTHWSKARLDQLIEQATVDAHGESEQRTAFFTMLDEQLDLPFEAQVLGVPVMIEAIDLTEADEIVALCRHGRERQRIPILELPLPTPRPLGAVWIQSRRRWPRGPEYYTNSD